MRPRIAVSACLLGAPVRFDGGHARDAFTATVLAQYVDLVSVCPELEAGMGVPRPTLRLVASPGGLAAVSPRTGVDWTPALERANEALVARLRAVGVHGAVLRKRSPSCGPSRVRVYAADGGAPVSSASGLFARALAALDVEVEDDGRLHDPSIRHGFLTRVFARARLEALFGAEWRMRDLVELHTREKLLLLASRPETYRELGALVAGAARLPRTEVAERYALATRRALASPPSRGRDANVLQHAAGFFRPRLSSPVRRDLDSVIRAYAAGEVDRAEPVCLVRHHVRTLEIPWLARQTYFEPFPEPLMRAA